MSFIKLWPDPDTLIAGLANQFMRGVYLLSPSTQKPVEPGQITNANANGQATKANSSPVVLPTDQWSPTSPNITEDGIRNWIRSGNGFMATCGNPVTATNTNLIVCALSLFNPSNSGKNVLIYSIRVGVSNSATGSSRLTATTTDPSNTTGYTNLITPANTKLGGSASVASASSSPSGITASVTPVGTMAQAFAITGNADNELLTNGAVLLLPSGSANGIAIFTFVSTVGNAFPATARWIEY